MIYPYRCHQEPPPSYPKKQDGNLDLCLYREVEVLSPQMEPFLETLSLLLALRPQTYTHHSLFHIFTPTSLN